MTDDKGIEKRRAYARDYARRRKAEDPTYRAKLQEAERRAYRKRKEDPAFLEAQRERNRIRYEKRAVLKSARSTPIRRGGSAAVDAIVGRQVRRCRKARGIATSVAAEQLGILPQQLAMYERGATTMTSATLHTLAQLYRVSVDTFFVALMDAPATAPPDPLDEEARALVTAYMAIGDPTVREILMALMERLGSPQKANSKI